MPRRVRTPLLLVALLLALITSSYFLWHGLRSADGGGDSGAPSLASSRKAVELLAKEAPPAEPPPLPPEQPNSQREKLTRDRNGREPASQPCASAELSGTVLDAEGRPVPGAQVLLARWIEDESAVERPRIPARIAVHLPIDLADPAAVGLPIPLQVQPDDSGHFAVALAPGRWRLLVRSTLAPYERNDLLLASSEQRELAPILLRPGIRYSFLCKDARGTRATDVRAAPLLAGLGADFPPLAGALELPFLMPPPRGDDPQLSLPQRPVPLSLWLAGTHTRAQRLQLDPASPALALTLLDADHLHGALQYTEPTPSGALTVHARPLDFFESPIPPEFRADIARVRAGRREFDLELPERSTLYELQATCGDEPPLLPSPWSPPRYQTPESSDEARPRHELLLEPLVWRSDAQLHFELVPSQPSLSSEPIELSLPGVYVRGVAPGEPIVLPEHSRGLGGLRLLRSPAAQLLLRLPGTQLLSQPLALVSGETCDLGRLALVALPMCRIQLTDASTSKPIPRATIRTADTFPGYGSPEPFGPLIASSDERGEAHAFATSLDTSSFEIRAPGYAPALVRASARAADGSLPVRLYRGATVRVRVFDSDAAPLRATLVECTGDEWTPDLGAPALLDTQSTDVQGCATFLRVTPGKHSFRIRSTRKLQPSEWSIVELGDTETLELSLATRTRTCLKVRVTDAFGPRAYALVTLEQTELDLPAGPLCADDPLPYGIDAYTDNRGEAFFEDLASARARLTLSVPDSPLRLRRSLRLRPGAQTSNFDLGDTVTIALAELPTASSLDLRILPQPITLRLDDDPIPLDALELEHTSRLDRRHGRPDLTFSLPGPIRGPPEVTSEQLLLTTPVPPLALDLDPDTDPNSTTPALVPALPLELSLFPLRPGERYVLVLGRTRSTQLLSLLEAHPEIRAQLPTDVLDDLSATDANARSVLLERTLPFIASAAALKLNLTHLLPGETLLRLYRLSPDRTSLLPDSAPQFVPLSADHSARLRLTTRD